MLKRGPNLGFAVGLPGSELEGGSIPEEIAPKQVVLILVNSDRLDTAFALRTASIKEPLPRLCVESQVSLPGICHF